MAQFYMQKPSAAKSVGSDGSGILNLVVWRTLEGDFAVETSGLTAPAILVKGTQLEVLEGIQEMIIERWDED